MPEDLNPRDIERPNALVPASDLDLLAADRVRSGHVDLRQPRRIAPASAVPDREVTGTAMAVIERPANDCAAVGRFDALEARGGPEACVASCTVGVDRKSPPRAIPRKNLWLALCLTIAALFAGHAMLGHDPSVPPTASVAPVPSPAPPPSHGATRNIEAIHVGQRVVAGNPDRRDLARSSDTIVDPVSWRLLRLHAEDRWADGTLDTVEVETLRPRASIEKHHASVGAMVPLPLDLVEMGMSPTLQAKVVADEPCPAIAKGPGRVVLTTVNHLNAYVFELQLADCKGHTETVRRPAFTSSTVRIGGDGCRSRTCGPANTFPAWPGR